MISQGNLTLKWHLSYPISRQGAWVLNILTSVSHWLRVSILTLGISEYDDP